MSYLGSQPSFHFLLIFWSDFKNEHGRHVVLLLLFLNIMSLMILVTAKFLIGLEELNFDHCCSIIEHLTNICYSSSFIGCVQWGLKNGCVW